jgi:hypothetical protein
MLRFVARVLIARQHDLFRNVFDRGNLDLAAVQTRVPGAASRLRISNFTALRMEPQSRIAGTASSLYGSITTLLGIGIGTKIGQDYDGTFLPFATGFFLCTSLAVVLVVSRSISLRAFCTPVPTSLAESSTSNSTWRPKACTPTTARAISCAPAPRNGR